jgi:hypothetical protein
MKITLLCITEPKMSYYDDNMTWFKEYSIGHFENEKERCEIGEKYPDALNYLCPCFSLRRRVDVLGGSTVCHDWEFLTFEKDIYSAALNIGDSDYYSAKSCNRIHEQVVAYTKKYGDLQKELTELNDRTIRPEYNKKSRLALDYNDKYDSELREKRLYKKAQKGTAPKEIVDEIRNRLIREYNEELKLIDERIGWIQRELSDMKVENF